MIIEIRLDSILLSYTPQWTLYYKNEDEVYFHEINLTYVELKKFLEEYAYETNNIKELMNFGISIEKIKENSKL